MINDYQLAEFVSRATKEVFSTMLGMELVLKPVAYEQQPPTVSEGVLAFVGMAGKWTGTGTVSCSAGFACRISAQFMGTDAPGINDEVLDAVGEVANMIVGNVKTMVEELVGPMGLSIPTVVYGRNFTTRSLGNHNWVVSSFTCDDDTIEVRACLAPAKTPSKAGLANCELQLSQ